MDFLPVLTGESGESMGKVNSGMYSVLCSSIAFSFYLDFVEGYEEMNTFQDLRVSPSLSINLRVGFPGKTVDEH